MRGIQTAAAAALLLCASVVTAATFTASQASVTVNGQQAYFKNVSGLTYESEVIEKDKPPALTLRVDANVDSGTFDWLRSSLSSTAASRTLVIRQGKQAATFRASRISAVSFPTLTRGDTAPAALQLKIQPGRGSLSTVKATSTSEVKSKKWLCSNFRFELGSLPADRVKRIDAFTVTTAAGGAKVEVPNLKITFAAGDARLQEWKKSNKTLPAKLTLVDSGGKPWARVVSSQVKVLILAPGPGGEQQATLSLTGASLTR